ncbi:MAG: hypothetical protein IT215_07465, partial [Chitinophagaceae bacterium]|nr:hypothetical protein [Chitinophagaceae bacterium]
GTVTEEFVRQAPRFNYIAKGIAYREAGMHSAKIPFSDHSIFDKYQGFLPRESSCSYKTSDLPKQCKSITVSKNKSGEIVLKNKSGSYKTPQSESSNIQVFLSKDAINLKNDTIEYFHEFVFNPDLWAITVFKNNEIIAKVTRKNFYLYDPLANRKKIKDSYISKVECDFASVSYIVKDKVLKIRDCEGDNEIASYY